MNTPSLLLTPDAGETVINGHKMRRLCGRWVPVLQVNVWKRGPFGAVLQIVFDCTPALPEVFRQEWCDMGLLAQALRQWRNLMGAPLVFEGEPAGKIYYNNSVLAEIAK